MTRSHNRLGFSSRAGRLVAAGALASTFALGTVGCNNAAEGAMSGAALGALAGLGIGALSGNEGDGAAIGAISGAVGGAIIGDQNARNERYSRNRRSDW